MFRRTVVAGRPRALLLMRPLEDRLAPGSLLFAGLLGGGLGDEVAAPPTNAPRAWLPPELSLPEPAADTTRIEITSPSRSATPQPAKPTLAAPNADAAFAFIPETVSVRTGFLAPPEPVESVKVFADLPANLAQAPVLAAPAPTRADERAADPASNMLSLARPDAATPAPAFQSTTTTFEANPEPLSGRPTTTPQPATDQMIDMRAASLDAPGRGGPRAVIETPEVDLKAFPHSYQAGGRSVPMAINPNRVAVRIEGTVAARGAVLNADTLPEGLTINRWITNNLAVLEGTEAATRAEVLAESGLTVVPVFTPAESGRDAILLDQVIVALEPGVTPVSVFDADPRVASYEPLAGTPDQFIVTTTVGAGLATLDVVNDLPAKDGVAWAAPNFYQDWQKLFTPNDTFFASHQWYLNNTGQKGTGSVPGADINATKAWDVTTGSPNVVIAIVDDGPELTHEDLAANVWVNPGEVANSKDSDGNGWVDDFNGWDFTTNGGAGDNNPGASSSKDFHGTSTAGLAAASGNNGKGVAGVAYTSKFMAIRIFGDDGNATTDANIASGIYYAAGRTKDGTGTWNAASVINNSWGGGAQTPTLDAAFEWAGTNGRGGLGVPNYFAAGNAGAFLIGYPANLSKLNKGVIAVGAHGDDDTWTGYSQAGPDLDFVTPSDSNRPGSFGITTTDRTGSLGQNFGNYTLNGEFGGTSTSAPLAAGFGALLMSAAPSLTWQQVRGIQRNTTDLVGGEFFSPLTGKATFAGTGRINAGTALSAVGGPEISVTFAFGETQSNDPGFTFGEVYVSESLTGTLRIRNQGTKALEISSISSSNSAFVTSPSGPTTIPVGEALPFTITFAPSAFDTTSGVVTIASNDADESSFLINVAGKGLVYSVAGSVFEDWNGNGVRNSNDPGLAGRTVYVDVNNNGVFDTTTTKFTQGTPLTIPDPDPFDGPTPVTSKLTVAGLAAPITDVNVTVNISHTWVSDLDATLIAPDGTRILLFAGVGGNGKNFTNTVLDDQATISIAAGKAPFTGSFQPFERLDIVNGKAGNGTWQLEMQDFFTGDQGTLLNWSVSIATGDPFDITNAVGGYGILGVPNGSQTVRFIPPVSDWVTTSGASGLVFTASGPPSVVINRDFGLAKNNRFYGRVFNDSNANGLLDVGEVGVSNRTVFIDSNANGVFDNATSTFTKVANLVIPDGLPGGGNGAKVFSPLAVSGLSGLVSDVNVTVNINHDFVADLDVFLISPDGTRVELFTDVGGNGKNFVNTVLDDQATISITQGFAPFTGKFRPEGLLSTFNNKAGNGTWQLELSDDFEEDIGTLINWSLEITSGETIVPVAANGNVFLDLPAGTTTIQLAPLAGFKFTSPANGKHAVTAAGAPIYERLFGTVEAIAPTLQSFAITADPGVTSTIQRSRVTGVRIQFSERVEFTGAVASAFTLTRGAAKTPVLYTATVDNTGPSTVVILNPTGADNQFGSFTDGRYRVTLLAPQIRDIAQNTFNGGVNVEQTFLRLFGDANGNGVVNAADSNPFRVTVGLTAANPGYRPEFDFNANNVINAADLNQFRARFGVSLPPL